jgi:hypothetical protein
MHPMTLLVFQLSVTRVGNRNTGIHVRMLVIPNPKERPAAGTVCTS